jgi:hypothetical protein
MILSYISILSAIAALGQSENSTDRLCERSKTNFGYVVVHKSDRRAAIREGSAVRSKARIELGLSETEFGIVDEQCSESGWEEPDKDNIAVYPWAFRAERSPEQSTPELQVLRHEIGHSLFIRFLIPSTKAIQYGGDAPDWLDEMAAVSFEAPDDRAIRRCELSLYARTSGLLPFKHFLSMTHPEHRREAATAQQRGFTSYAPSNKETPIFYAMVSGFDDYLRARLKGKHVVPELVNAFRRGRPLGEFLVNELKLKNEGGNFHELDADFKDWMASDKRMQKAAKCFDQQ